MNSIQGKKKKNNNRDLTTRCLATVQCSPRTVIGSPFSVFCLLVLHTGLSMTKSDTTEIRRKRFHAERWHKGSAFPSRNRLWADSDPNMISTKANVNFVQGSIYSGINRNAFFTIQIEPKEKWDIVNIVSSKPNEIQGNILQK